MNAISIEREPSSPPVVADQEGQFRRNYNRVNFMFKHELAGNPLFELASLVELTRRMPDHGEHYWSNGKVLVNNTWSDGTVGRQSLQDTIIDIEHNNSIVILKHTEQDPLFAPVLQNVLGRMTAPSTSCSRATACMCRRARRIGFKTGTTCRSHSASTTNCARLTGWRNCTASIIDCASSDSSPPPRLFPVGAIASNSPPRTA